MKRGLVFIISLLFVCAKIQAQSFNSDEHKQIDSLKKLIASPTTHDTTLAASYLRLSEILYVSNFDTLVYFGNKTIQLSDKILATSPSPSITRSLKISRATALNNIGFVYSEKGNNTQALENYHLCLRVYEELNDLDGIGTSLNNIGSIYDNQEDFENALVYYKKCYAIRAKMQDKKGMAVVLNNIGSTYDEMGRMEEALVYFRKSMVLRENIKDKDGIAITYNNIGLVLYRLKDYEQALTYFNRSIDLYRQIDYKIGTAVALHNIGLVYFDKNDISKAEKFGLESMEVAQQVGYPEYIKRAANLLSKVYQKQNKWKQAFDMNNLYITMRDSVNNEKTKANILKQEIQYTYDKQKALDNKEHEKQLAVEQEQKQRQKIISLFIGISLLLVIVFAAFIVNRLKVTKQQKLIIEHQKHIVDEKNKEVTDSINYAKRIQEAILPTPKEMNKHLKNGFVIYLPKDIVAGDFYWMEVIGDLAVFAAADCTGHGVPGAMVSVVCNGALNRSVREYKLTEPAQILNKTRELVIETFEKSNADVRDGMDIALCSLNINSKELQYAGANNPLYIVRNNELIEIKADKQPIGKHDGAKPFTNHKISLQPNDSLYVFTDGITDQFGGPKGKKFMHKPLKEMLLSIQNVSMDEQKTLIENRFKDWKGNLDQVDDICMVAVKII